MKLSVIAAASVGVLVLSSCAITDAPRSKVVEDESCRITGSNLPKRECRGAVTVLPPSALENAGFRPARGRNN